MYIGKLGLPNAVGPCAVVRKFVDSKRAIQDLDLGVKLGLWLGRLVSAMNSEKI
jgi:hypothetical protein